MKTKLYIAGKVTGDPDYKAKFEAAADEYKKNGYTVLNPAWMPEGMLPADYMRICFAMIDTADVVAFLPGYKTSSGAQLELQYCFYTDKNTKIPDGESLETPIQQDIKRAEEFIESIKKLNNCNSCRNIPYCLFAPSEGESVRFNCPFYAKQVMSSVHKRNCRHTVPPYFGKEAKP